ncbi:MAG: ATP-binding cassette domain-containing protein [Hyphomicrobiaceae bacterium]|nr:ATP-binding cassette domain-containing protein [Hyphomicrobiaceae bacterium]
MRCSSSLVRQVRGALRAATACAVAAGLCHVFLALVVMRGIDAAAGFADTHHLTLLAAAGAVFLLAGLALDAIADRIRLRAAVWLDYEASRRQLAAALFAGCASGDGTEDAGRHSHLVAALTDPAMAAVTRLPLVPVLLAAAALLLPVAALVALSCGLVVLLLALMHSADARRLQPAIDDAADAAGRWRGLAGGAGALAAALGLAEGLRVRHEAACRRAVGAAYALGRHGTIISALARSARLAAGILVVGLAAIQVSAGALSTGGLVAVALLVDAALAPLAALAAGMPTLRAAKVAQRHLSGRGPLVSAEPAFEAADRRSDGALRLSEVSFTYPGAQAPALRRIGLVVAPGCSLAVVGPAGSGKSTLARIMAGLVAPHDGMAEFDGIPLDIAQRNTSEPPIGYLPEAGALYPGSVHDNIARYQDADRAAVVQAAASAGVVEILSGLPDGYDTSIGWDGSGLSAREARAVALARAVFGSPRFIVLDSPEAGLDDMGVRRLAARLVGLQQAGCGLILFTSEPRLVELADSIAVLDNGALRSLTRRTAGRIAAGHARETGHWPEPVDPIPRRATLAGAA